jgi:hypothetical protein
MSYKSEVIADSTGKFCGNALRFATREEAELYVADFAWRWTVVRDTRVIECEEPVNYRYEAGHLVSVEKLDELRREDETARELDPDSAEAQDIERNR